MSRNKTKGGEGMKTKNTNKRERILSFLLSACLLLTLFPFVSIGFAEADTLIIPLPQGDELLGDDGEIEPQNMLCLNGGSIAGFDSAASYTEAVKKCGIVPYSFELY